MGRGWMQWHTTPVLLPGKSHGHRSLVGYSPWGRKELDMTQWLSMAQHSTVILKIRFASVPTSVPTRLSDFTFTFHFHALEKEMAACSSVLAWRMPGTVEPDGLPSMGSHRVRHDWRDLAAAAATKHDYSLLLPCHSSFCFLQNLYHSR